MSKPLGENITSEIIESGSNENGSWVKFADGTMICTYDKNVTDQSISNVYGSLYQGTRTWNFPQEFYTTPVVTCNSFHWGSGASWGTSLTSSKTSVILRGVDAFLREVGTNCYISATAIGKWK